MGTIVLERVFDPPIRVGDLAVMEAQAAECMGRYRVDHLLSLLAADGHDLVCVFAAPDAEAVRRVMQQLAAPFRRAWAATVHAAPGHSPDAPLAAAGDAAIVLVERAFAAPVEFATVQAQEDAGAWCLEQHGVRFLRSYFSLDRRRMTCLCAAPDAEAVRAVQRQVALPHERVWRAQVWETPEHGG